MPDPNPIKSKSVVKRLEAQGAMPDQDAMNSDLPKPISKLGYSHSEILSICRDRKIHHKRFWKAFGDGNTCALEKVGDEEIMIFYVCDVERALHILGKGGRYHEWD